MQRHFNLRPAPRAPQPRRDHLGIVEDQQIPHPQQIRQIGDGMIRQPVRDAQKFCGFAGAGRSIGNAFRRQGKVEKVNVHNLNANERPGMRTVRAQKE